MARSNKEQQKHGRLILDILEIMAMYFPMCTNTSLLHFGLLFS
jgi:hypothetical protein